MPIAIYHCSIKIISRGRGKSAVAAAAYRSGEKITNEYDGAIHDYTKKGGVVHTEILLPENAPPKYINRTILWNAVEKTEKAKNSQLAREIELALPAELTFLENKNLVRDYVKRNFSSKGMCADICIHDKKDGNPHAHIMLTMRPFNEDGSWGDKQKKDYILGKNGEKIYDKNTRQYKCKSVPTTDWNEQSKAEEWRASWADISNAYLKRLSHTAQLDHRSYERQGIEQIPTIHMGVAATQMERKGIATDRGNVNRGIINANLELKQLRARINKLKKWLNEEMESFISPAETKLEVNQQAQKQPANLVEILTAIINPNQSKTRYRQIMDLKTAAKALAFLQANNITTLPELSEKVKAMNSDWSGISDKIKPIERRLKVLAEHIYNAENYLAHKAIYKQHKNEKPKKQEAFYQANADAIILYEAADKYLKQIMNGKTTLPLKSWKDEAAKLTAEKTILYRDYNKLKEEVREVEIIKKAAEHIERAVPGERQRNNQEQIL